MSDVVVSAAPRTYPLPESVREEVRRGLNWEGAYAPVGDAMTASSAFAAKMLLEGGSLTADAIAILASLLPPRPEDMDPTAPGFPSAKRIEYAQHGGDPLRRWSSKIAGGTQKTHDAMIASTFERIGYFEADDMLRYAGLSYDQEDDSTIRALVRVNDEFEYEEWVPATSEWRPVEDLSMLRQYDATVLDSSLVAAVVIALDDSEGLQLMTSRPGARLLFEAPLVAAADASQTAGTHYYAIVDRTDRTAVMNAISISPGPIVKTREGGQWVDDPKVTASLLSVQPPPLIELDSNSLSAVLAQIDGTVTAAQQNPDYVESLGHEKDIEESKAKELTDKAQEFTARKQMTQSMQASAVRSLIEERDARLRKIDVEIEKSILREQERIEAGIVASAKQRERIEEHRIELLEERRDVEYEYSAIIASAARRAMAELSERESKIGLLASASIARAGEFSAADARAEAQKYWVAGRGAIRQLWGCTREGVS